MKIGLKSMAGLALWAMLGSPHAQDSSAGDWIRNPGMGNCKAYAEFKMANYAAARHFMRSAEDGDAEAQYAIAVMSQNCPPAQAALAAQDGSR